MNKPKGILYFSLFFFISLSFNLSGQNLFHEIFEDYKKDVYSDMYHDISKDTTSIWLENLKTDSMMVSSNGFKRFDYWQVDSTGKKVGFWISYIENEKLTIMEGINNPYFNPLVIEYIYLNDRKVLKINYEKNKKIKQRIKKSKHPNNLGIIPTTDLF